MTRLPKNKWPDLTKWPGLVVVGDKVTEDQAKEIIMRTDGLWFGTNDDAWAMELYQVLGIATGNQAIPNPDHEEVHAVNTKIGGLSLEHLVTERIASCYIGGPHGWCDWKGNLVGYNTNIGKWPHCGEVYADWVKIAKAFPFIRLTCQLLDSVGHQEACDPVIEYRVKEGKVSVHAPEAPLLPSQVTCIGPDFSALMRGEGHERGCTLDMFREAYEHTLNQRNDRRAAVKHAKKGKHDGAN